jgi:pantothenate kinase
VVIGQPSFRSRSAHFQIFLTGEEKMLIDEINQEIYRIVDRTPDGQRYVLGVAGPPGVGKSTSAECVVHAANQRCAGVAVVAPMDGFHLPNEVLTKKGLLPLKGIPKTFDVRALIAALKAVRENLTTVGWPLFDRSIEASKEGGIVIKRHHRLVVVEGNYLLLKRGPWRRVAGLLDECWYIDGPEDLIYTRLIERHLAAGMSLAAATEKVNSTDLPNARLVAKHKNGARIIPAEKLVLPRAS